MMGFNFLTAAVRMTNFFYTFSLNIVPFVALCFLFVFILKNPIFNRRQALLFIFATALCALAILSNGADFILSQQFGENFHPAAFAFRRITSFINFAATPVVPFLLYLILDAKKIKRWIYAPLIANTLICFLSIFFKIVFFIRVDNTYVRGVLFFSPFAISLFYIGLLMFKRVTSHVQSKREERIFLIAVIVSLVLGMSLEIIKGSHFLSWNFAAMSMILYYLLLNIHGQTLDPLTGIFSRRMYEHALEKIDHEKNCVLALLDINDFKKTNDTLGHDEGDRILKKFAERLNLTMSNTATVYRIGGDEFFCISKKADRAHFDRAVAKLRTECAHFDIRFACGIVNYNCKQDILADSLKEADDNMYKDKQQMKTASNQAERT